MIVSYGAESEDQCHNHRGVLAALEDDRIGPMPELESLRRPLCIRVDWLKDRKTRHNYLEPVAAAVVAYGTAQGTPKALAKA